MKTSVRILATLIAILLFPAATAFAEGPNAVINNASCQGTELPANDDGSSPLVNLPFGVNFFGDTYNTLYVNNNGNVTFDEAMSDYTPFPLLTTNRVLIAPFFGDVDTRGTGSQTTHYGNISAGATEVAGHQAFCVNWIGVGYYGAHDDKLNSFQLVLIDRSDTGPGNFDIEFNYDKVQWEAGDASGGTGGLGGSPARIGYSNGTTTSFELPGSGTSGAFLDSNTTTGLIANDINAPLQNGRYIFPVRNGAATGHSLSGHIWANTAGTPANGAFVQACPVPADTPCRNASSNADGAYSFSNLPDHTSGGGAVDHSWNLTVHPPSGSGLSTGQAGPISVAGIDAIDRDITLHGPQPLPNGASLGSPSFGNETSGTPSIYWNEPTTLTVSGCAGGTGSATITVADDGYTQTIALTEGPAGMYRGTIPAVYPHHGTATITYTLSCGDSGSFDLYIDPSGLVRTPGGAPISGATVTLLRSDDPAGPFVAVPDGSAIMSPANRHNPSTTTATGQFGWDVLAGYYKVRASKDGCHAQGDVSQASVETGVLTIPPPVTGLELVLDCTVLDTTPPDITASGLTAEATGPTTVVNYTFHATDAAGTVMASACLPAPGSSFTVGSTTIHCTATDDSHNTRTQDFAVVVSDTTPPSLTVPANITVTAPNASGAAVNYVATATDLVDGAVTPACSKASGSTFPVGDTVVTCTATDAHGNHVTKTFNVHVNQPADTTAATCTVTATGTASGKKYVEITVQDTGSGVASIQVTESVNATTPVPTFTAGTKNGVVVRSTKTNQNLTSTVALRVKDVAGNVVDCDPSSVSLRVKTRGGAVIQRLKAIPANEHNLRIDNGRPGLAKIVVRVNGKRFKTVRLRAGRSTVLDLSRAMHAGSNTVTFTGSGAKRGSASVLISD